MEITQNTSSAGPTTQEIQAMFDRLAARYNAFNFFVTGGLENVWRGSTVRDIRKGDHVLDIGCGTGDLSFAAARKAGVEGRVQGVDFSAQMISIANRRKSQGCWPQVSFVEQAAENVSGEALYDAAVSGFVLRNIYEHLDQILGNVFKVLKTGGKVRFLDLTEPKNGALKSLWRVYMNSAVRFYGRMLFGKNYPEQYLVQSAHRFLKKDEFLEKLSRIGFANVRVKSFMFGIIVLYQAEKP